MRILRFYVHHNVNRVGIFIAKTPIVSFHFDFGFVRKPSEKNNRYRITVVDINTRQSKYEYYSMRI